MILIAAGIFTIALLVRLLVLAQTSDLGFMTQPLSDARIYADRATGIAEGDWSGPADFVHAPLYAYLLAPIAWLTDAPNADNYEWLQTARVIQLVLGSLACALMLPMALAWLRSINPAKSLTTSTIAALALALYPPAIFYDLLIQKTTIDLLLTITILWLLAKAWFPASSHPSPRIPTPGSRLPSSLFTWATLGILIALFTLNRQNALALAVLLIAMPPAQAWPHTNTTAKFIARIIQTLKRAAPPIAIALIAIVLTLLPWAARNRAVLGDWVISTPNLGQNLLMGNRADATGTYLPTVRGRGTAEYEQDIWVASAERALNRELTAREVSNYYRDEALNWIKDNPADWLALTARKTVMLLGAFEAPDTEDLYHYRLHSPILNAADTLFHFGILLPISTLGLILTARRWRALWPLYAWLAITAATTVAFVVFGRYRFPMIPPLTLFAAIGLVQAITLIQARGFRALILPALAAIAAAFIANWPIHHPRAPQVFSFVNHATVLADLGRLDEARAEAQRAIDLDPQNPDGYAIRASIALDQNRFAEAEQDYATATTLDPSFPGAWTGLGNTRLITGRILPALEAYERSLNLWPDDPTTLAQFGAALAQIGEIDQAAAAIDRALTLDPDNHFALNNLGNLFLLMEQPEAAIQTLTRAINTAPNRVEPRLALIAAHFNTGNTAQAITTARETWQAFPADPRTQQTYFEVLLRAQQFNEALDALNEIRDKDPEAIWTQEAEQQLRQALNTAPDPTP